MKEPVPSHKHRVGGDAWHLKQQGLQQDVLWLVGGKSGFKTKNKQTNIFMESVVEFNIKRNDVSNLVL